MSDVCPQLVCNDAAAPCAITRDSMSLSRGNLFALSLPDCRHLDKDNFFFFFFFVKADTGPASNWANIFCKPDSFANIMVGWDSIAVRAHFRLKGVQNKGREKTLMSAVLLQILIIMCSCSIERLSATNQTGT